MTRSRPRDRVRARRGQTGGVRGGALRLAREPERFSARTQHPRAAPVLDAPRSRRPRPAPSSPRPGSRSRAACRPAYGDLGGDGHVPARCRGSDRLVQRASARSSLPSAASTAASTPSAKARSCWAPPRLIEGGSARGRSIRGGRRRRRPPGGRARPATGRPSARRGHRGPRRRSPWPAPSSARADAGSPAATSRPAMRTRRNGASSSGAAPRAAASPCGTRPPRAQPALDPVSTASWVRLMASPQRVAQVREAFARQEERAALVVDVTGVLRRERAHQVQRRRLPLAHTAGQRLVDRGDGGLVVVGDERREAPVNAAGVRRLRVRDLCDQVEHLRQRSMRAPGPSRCSTRHPGRQGDGTRSRRHAPGTSRARPVAHRLAVQPEQRPHPAERRSQPHRAVAVARLHRRVDGEQQLLPLGRAADPSSPAAPASAAGARVLGEGEVVPGAPHGRRRPAGPDSRSRAYSRTVSSIA